MSAVYLLGNMWSSNELVLLKERWKKSFILVSFYSYGSQCKGIQNNQIIKYQ